MTRLLNISLLILSLVSQVYAQETYEVTKLPLPEGHDHYMPVLYEDQIVFTSSFNEEAVLQYQNKKTKALSTSIMAVKANGAEVDGRPNAFTKTLNGNLNEGPASFAQDGKTMFYSKNVHAVKFGNDRKEKNVLGIFTSTMVDGSWQHEVAFTHNSEEFDVAHPAVSADGRTVIFVSNMPGGHGGTDLYRSELVHGEWSKPVNLGPTVNSASNEYFPTLLPGNLLYFSSDREGGFGMLDIYACKMLSNTFSTPKALPEPLNSMADDIGYAPLPDQRSGYISSNRNGQDEVLYFKRTIPLFMDCKPQVENNYCYVFSEEGSMQDQSLPLAYQWDLGDGTLMDGTEAEHCFTGPGTYTVKLNIIDTITESIFFNEASYKLVIEDTQQPYISVNGELNSRREILFSAARSILPGKEILEYHWDLGDSLLVSGMEVEERFKKPGDRTVKLDVIFAPDSTGRIRHQCVTRNIRILEPKQLADYAQEVVRIEYTDAEGNTYTFDYQELPYDLFNMTVKDGEEVFFTVELMNSKERISINDPFFDKAREKFRITENYISEQEHFSYTVGQEKTLEATFPIFQELKTMEYQMAEVKAIKVEKVKEIANPHDIAVLQLMDMEELNNTVLRMSTVYFNTGDHEITEEFTDALNNLLDAVKDLDKIDLEISAHTDNVGPDNFNQILSEKRAESIVEYLVARGLERNRMIAIGYGEDKPIAPNTTKVGRQANRRVEFKLVANSLLSSQQ